MLIQVMVANKYKEEKKMCAYLLSCLHLNNTWQEWDSLPPEAGLQGLPASSPFTAQLWHQRCYQSPQA